MKPFDDSLRVCPFCNAKTSMTNEDRIDCLECRQKVWFYNFRPVADPPEIPKAKPLGLFGNPTTSALVFAILILSLTALLAFFKGSIVAVCSSLVAIGFGVFAFLQQRHAAEVESSLRFINRMEDYATLMRNRLGETINRYNALLANGDARIRHYYETIGRTAEEDRTAAIRFRNEAAHDRAAIADVEKRIYSMADRFVTDHLAWIARKLRPDSENYQRCLLELTKAFDFVESVGYRLPRDIPKKARDDLKRQYMEEIREQQEKEKQQAIKKQMREDERVRREREAALREAEERERDLQSRLVEALKHQKDQHGSEIEQLKQELAEAQARAERAKSMAQLTKAGNVYILSNIGSFGEEVFKVGMTRREEPLDRVRELGDASVPFPFDVHAMIQCDDAPRLENTLHQELTRFRVNRVNLRKEYFRVSLDTILMAVEKHHGKITYVASPEALEYRATLTTTPEEVEEFEQELAEAGISLDEPE